MLGILRVLLENPAEDGRRELILLASFLELSDDFIDATESLVADGLVQLVGVILLGYGGGTPVSREGPSVTIAPRATRGYGGLSLVGRF